MPGCILPLKRTSTDSGMSSGITPVAAAKATRPEPAGKEMPIGKRVWRVAAGADGVGQQQAVEPGVDDAVAGRSETPPRAVMKLGSVRWVLTSTSFG